MTPPPRPHADVGTGSPPAEQQGAVAYDANGFDAGNVVRATTQAVLGLSGVGLADLSLTGATGDACQ